MYFKRPETRRVRPRRSAKWKDTLAPSRDGAPLRKVRRSGLNVVYWMLVWDGLDHRVPLFLASFGDYRGFDGHREDSKNACLVRA
jgi:hypothetical protein